MANQLREALEEAFNADESPDEEKGEVVDKVEESTAAESAKDEVVTSDDKGDPAEEVTEDALQEQTEDETETKDEAEEVKPSHKPPQSWRPAVREHWSKLPGEVQAEVTKRELEINRALVSSAGARKLEQEFTETMRPYEGIIRSYGVSPVQAAGNLMQTSAKLHLGTPQQKAQVVVEVIKNFGIDLEMLDQMLAGQVPVGEEDKISRLVDQRLAPVNQFLQNLSSGLQQRRTQTAEQTLAEVEEFGKSADFFEDVRDDMADIMEVASRRGVNLTLKDAYDRALAMRPDLSGIVAQRAAATNSVKNQAVVQKARRAASSVSGAPTGGKKVASTETVRGTIEEAWDEALRK